MEDDRSGRRHERSSLEAVENGDDSPHGGGCSHGRHDDRRSRQVDQEDNDLQREAQVNGIGNGHVDVLPAAVELAVSTKSIFGGSIRTPSTSGMYTSKCLYTPPRLRRRP
jgi:hypothetical protein